jgi:hypothetical protein
MRKGCGKPSVSWGCRFSTHNGVLKVSVETPRRLSWEVDDALAKSDT